MTTTVMPERPGVSRIPAVSRFVFDERTRTDLSVMIGLDVDLVLGADVDPVRAAALTDMVDAGFVSLSDAFARLVGVELELDADENSDEIEVLGGWAA